MRFFVIVFIVFIFLTACSGKKNNSDSGVSDSGFGEKPNIVWIMLEDWSYQLSCYGEKGISTPFIDKVAAEGIKFTNSFSQKIGYDYRLSSKLYWRSPAPHTG